MRLNLGLIADYADVTRAGKIVIAGEFDSVYAPAVPIQLAAASVVLRVEADEAAGTQHRVILGIVSEKGEAIASLGLVRDVVFSATLRPGVARGSVIFDLRGLRLPEFGMYRIDVSVDGKIVGNIPFRLVKASAAEPHAAPLP